MLAQLCRCVIAIGLAPLLLLGAILVLVLVRPVMVVTGVVILSGALLGAVSPGFRHRLETLGLSPH